MNSSTRDAAHSRAYALGLMSNGRPIQDSPAALRYLARRNLLDHGLEAARFASAVRFPDSSRAHAAILYPVTNPATGEFLAVQRNAIEPDGRKAPIKTQKAALGATSGGAVVIGLLHLMTTAVECEGTESALSVFQATTLASIATLSCGALGRPLLPPSVREVIIWAEPGAEKHVARAVEMRTEQGLKVRVARSCDPDCKDPNDLLIKHGRERGLELVRACIEAAVVTVPAPKPASVPVVKSEPAKAIAADELAERMQKIADAAIDRAVDALASAGDGDRGNAAAYRCALSVGKFVPDGYATKADLTKRIVSACTKNGHIGTGGKGSAVSIGKAVENALRDSKSHDLPTLKPRPPSKYAMPEGEWQAVIRDYPYDREHRRAAP